MSSDDPSFSKEEEERTRKITEKFIGEHKELFDNLAKEEEIQEEPRKEVTINPLTGLPLKEEEEEDDVDSIITEATTEDELSFTDYMRFLSEDLHGIRGSLQDMTTLQREHNVLMRRLYKTMRSLSMTIQKGGGGGGGGGGTGGGEEEEDDVDTRKNMG